MNIWEEKTQKEKWVIIERTLVWNFNTDKYFWWRLLWRIATIFRIKIKRPLASYKFNEIFAEKLQFHEVLNRLHEQIIDEKKTSEEKQIANALLKHLIINYVTPRYILFYSHIILAGDDLDITEDLLTKMLQSYVPTYDKVILSTMRDILLSRSELFGDTITE